jgi:ATP-dependent DNA ligase
MWLQLVYRCLPSLSDGETVFAHACKLGLEGIVSKRTGSAYRSGRSPDWLKMKNPVCAAVTREAEEDWGRGVNLRAPRVRRNDA